jgi:hypothetical protein
MGKRSPLPKHARDNRANQLNPNNGAYRRSRGLSTPPDLDFASSDPKPTQPSRQPSSSIANRKSD